MTRYAELDVTTNFTFLRGGSHPEELVATAKALQLDAIAVTDSNTLAGIVRGHLAAKEVGIKFIVGARLDLLDAPSLLVYPRDRAAYGRLCRLLTLGQRRTEKGQCTLYLDDVAALAEGLIFIALPPEDFPSPCKGEGGDGRRPSPGGGHVSRLEMESDPLRPSPFQGEGDATHAQFRAAPSPRQTGDLGTALPRGAAFLSRRRSRPHLSARRSCRARRYSPRRHRRRALSRAPSPPPARRAHLHPREMHGQRRGLAPGGQCRAAPQTGTGDGAPVQRP